MEEAKLHSAQAILSAPEEGDDVVKMANDHERAQGELGEAEADTEGFGDSDQDGGQQRTTHAAQSAHDRDDEGVGDH